MGVAGANLNPKPPGVKPPGEREDRPAVDQEKLDASPTQAKLNSLVANRCVLNGPQSDCACQGDYTKCTFGIKNSRLKHCRFWRFDKFCDNHEAQKAAQT